MTWSPVVFALAESAAFGFNGNVSAVNILGPKVGADNFPAAFAPSLVVVMEEENPSGALQVGSAKVTISVTTDDGATLFFNQADVPLTQLSAPDDPEAVGRLQAVAQIPITLDRHIGLTFSVHCALPGGSFFEASRRIRVVPQAMMAPSVAGQV